MTTGYFEVQKSYCGQRTEAAPRPPAAQSEMLLRGNMVIVIPHRAICMHDVVSC
jgi:hypothetical protein